MPNFAFYSTDIAATVNPASAEPAPTTLVVLDQLPLFGQYDLHGGEVGRGSAIKTLGGQVVQDFGVVVTDKRISFSENDALSASVVAALKTIHETVNGEYYFTDGFNVWKVRFARPGGFRYWRNLLFAQHSTNIFSYEINLIVVSEAI